MIFCERIPTIIAIPWVDGISFSLVALIQVLVQQISSFIFLLAGLAWDFFPL